MTSKSLTVYRCHRNVEFRQLDCKNCPVRNQCTRAKTNPRGLTIQAQSDYEALQKARVRQKTEEFQKQYQLRSGIEGTISQRIRAFELRDCRYIGLAKTHLQHILENLNLLQFLTPDVQLRESDEKMLEFKALAVTHRHVSQYLGKTYSCGDRSEVTCQD